MHKDIQEERAYQKLYREKNKSRLSQRRKIWFKNHPEAKLKRKEYNRIWVKKHRKLYPKKYHSQYLKYDNKVLDTWRGYIPSETNCECCEKKIYFNVKSFDLSLCFDHRHGLNQIKNVSAWMRRHTFNEKNRAIFESCDFGIICRQCNNRLPTENRTEFLKNANRYHFGDSMLYAKQGSTSVEPAKPV